MRFQPDLLLERNHGDRLKAGRGLFLLLAEVFLHGVPHRFRFGCRLGFGLDPEPGPAVRRIANVSHASSTIASKRNRDHDWRERVERENPRSKAESTPGTAQLADILAGRHRHSFYIANCRRESPFAQAVSYKSCGSLPLSVEMVNARGDGTAGETTSAPPMHGADDAVLFEFDVDPAVR